MLAKDTKNKYKNVEFFAVSCDQHRAVCQELEISGYPTLRVYQAGTNEGEEVKHASSFTPEKFAGLLNLQPKPSGLVSSTVDRRRMDDGEGSDEQDGEENEKGSGENEDGEEEEESTDAQEKEESNEGKEDSPEDKEESPEDKDDESPEEEEESPEEEEEEEDRDNGPSSQRDNPPPGAVNVVPKYNTPAGVALNQREPPAKLDRFGRPLGVRPGMEPFGADSGRGNLGPARRPGAGHMKAATQYKEMDRFQEKLKEHREKYQNKRQGLGKLMHKDPTRGRDGQPVERTNPEVMTPAMRANTPGTKEYEERKKKIIDRIEKLRKKRGIKSKHSGSVAAPRAPLTKETLPFKKDVRKPNFIKKTAERLPIAKRFAKMTPEEELILDVSMSFVTGLDSGVFMTGKELNMMQRKALRNYLDLLSIALPAEWGLHKLIDDLRRRMPFIAKSSENLVSVLRQHPLPRHGWSQSCTPGGRMGFTCGFWKLMHVATVGIAQQRGGLNLIDSGMVSPESKTFSPIEAADVLRNYIETFFTCSVCKKHFVEHYDKCENNRRCDRLTDELEDASTADWKELAVWLWEVHNEVSVRIVNENAGKQQNLFSTHAFKTDPGRRASIRDEVKAIWPNIETCFMCFEDDGTWDEEEVFKFLERNYW